MIKTYVKIFKALANPHRLEIFLSILDYHQHGGPVSADRGPLTIDQLPHGCCLLNHIVSKLNIGMPTISHHVKELVNADLITTQKFGKYVGVSLNEVVWRKFQKDFFYDHSDDTPNGH